MNQPILKLYYFDIPGKGEAIRLALTYAGFQFEDIRISFDDFNALKADGTLKFGQVPALQVTMNGKTNTICQSASIMRFIGRIAIPDLLFPTDIIQASIVDSLLDEEIDLFMGLAVSRYRGRFGFEAIGDYNGPILQDIRKCLNDDIIPKHLQFFENLLSESTTGWLANTYYPSIADFQIVPRLQWLAEHGEGISSDILKPFTRVNNLIDKLMNDPCVQSYYEKK